MSRCEKKEECEKLVAIKDDLFERLNKIRNASEANAIQNPKERCLCGYADSMYWMRDQHRCTHGEPGSNCPSLPKLIHICYSLRTICWQLDDQLKNIYKACHLDRPFKIQEWVNIIPEDEQKQEID